MYVKLFLFLLDLKGCNLNVRSLGSLILWFLIILFFFVHLIYSLRECDTHLQQLYKCYIIFVNIFKEFDLNIENYSNIDKSFEKVKYLNWLIRINIFQDRY
jgi:hypothetical protein